jgi:mono/diheme cytochrome c family protein
MTTRIRLSFLLAATAAVAACGGYTPPATANGAPSKQTAPVAATGAKEAKEIFASLCFTCHGSTGHGDGPGAATLNPKPRTFADVAWQDSVTDEHIAKTIVYGGAAVGKSPVMVANPQLKGKTEVVASLVKIVRDFRGK